jgi:nucleoid DNA-binding protein
MTDTSIPSTRISDGPPGSSYVEWSAIFAGAMLTSAIIVLMTAFGSAIGLSLVSPYHGPSPILFYVVLALWFTWITVSSFVAGGYVTGRLRRPIEGATPHEVHVRDGAHGLVVWAVAVVIGTALATFSLSSAVTTLSLSSAIKGGSDLVKSGASAMASSVGLNADPMGYEVDTLLRSDGNTAAGKSASAGNSVTVEPSRRDAAHVLAMAAVHGSLSGDDRIYVARAIAAHGGLSRADAEKRVDAIFVQVKAAADKVRDATETARKAGIIVGLSVTPNAEPIGSGVDSTPRGDGNASAVKSGTIETSRQEVSRILLTSAANGSLSSDDHAYLVRIVAAHANLTQADAEKRVDALAEQMRTSAEKVRATTETARKGGILLAFLTAATMVLGAAAAWWGAGVGGRPRDENFDASHLTRW